jgi:tetratricopeptide (TPR) repeat protein
MPINIKDAKDVIGPGSSGTGNIFGKEVHYTVQGSVINIHIDNPSSEVLEALRNVISVPINKNLISESNDYTQEVRVATKQINQVLDDVKRLAEKEGTQIEEIKAGGLRVSTSDLWYNKGLVLDKQGNLEQAITSYDKAIEIKPGYANAWYSKGLAFGKLGDYKKAMKCFDKAIEIKPGYANAWYSKGLAFGKLGKRKQAIKCFDKVTTIAKFME